MKDCRAAQPAFPKIPNDFQKSSKTNPSIVCDQWVGEISIRSKKIEKNSVWFSLEERIKHSEVLRDLEKSDKLILIVLESPHKDEFQENSLGPSPALGTTGRNLQSSFVSNLSMFLEINQQDSLPEGNYKIILSNAIQFQASWGYPTNTVRDRFWLYWWLLCNERKGFIKRLQLYKPDVILISCTDGNHKNDPFADTQKKKVELTEIRFGFIKALVNDIIKIESGALRLNKEEVYGQKYVIKTSTGICSYPLRGFVVSAASKAIFNENSKPLLLHSYHPSSPHFKRGFFQSFNRC